MKRAFANIGFSMAVALILLNLLPFSLALPITIGLTIIFIVSLTLSKFRQAVTVPLCVGTALLACLFFLLFYHSTVLPQLALDNQTAIASFYIIDAPERVDDSYIYTIRATEILFDNAPQGIKMKLKTDFMINAQPYQILKASLDFDSIGDRAFLSSGNWSDGVFLTARAGAVEATKQFISTPFKWIYNLRLGAIKLLLNGVGGDESAISVALTTGYRSLISRSLRSMFTSAGASHIMAVSGFHLVVVIGSFVAVLKGLKVKQKASSVITIILVALFIFFTGCSKSIVRAGVMMIVLQLGNLIDRRADSLNSLGLAVFIMCLNPFAVADIGAQLSVASTLSLIVLYPKIRAKITNRIFARVFGYIAIPFSVLVFTMPIMYLFFGYINLATLFSNIFVTLLGSFSIVFSFLTLISLKTGIATGVFVWIIRVINKCFIKVVGVFASFGGTMINLDSGFGIALAGVFLIFAFVYMLGNMKLLKIAGIASSLIMIFAIVMSSITMSSSAQLLVTRNGAVALACNNKVYVYGADSEYDYSSINNFINSNSASVETIIVNNNDECSFELAEEHSCSNYITPFSDLQIDLDFCDYYECTGDYSYSNDDVKISAVKNDKMSYCVLGVKNVTIVATDVAKADCDIFINDRIVKDSNGKIDLANGDIVYTIYNNSFKARRVDSWLK